MRLTACLITRDEEKVLGRCLDSLRGHVDTICLADTGSRDATISVARARGASVVSIPWEEDFAKARNRGLDASEGDWILQVDADEELDPSTAPRLREAMSGDSWCHLVEVVLQDGTDHPGVVLLPRLFRRHPSVRYRRALHESVLDSLLDAGHPTPLPCGVRLIHHGYGPDEASQASKRERNLRILRAARARGESDTYDLYKIATTLLPWGEEDGERSDALEAAIAQARLAPRTHWSTWPWLATLVREAALAAAHRGHFAEGWSLLHEFDLPSGATASARAQILLRTGHHQDALAAALAGLDAGSGEGLSARDGRARGRDLHLAAQCRLACGQDPEPLLLQASEAGSLEARCDLAVRRIKRNLQVGWSELDQMMRRHPGHPVVLLAGSEAALAHGDRSTSDLLLSQASKVPSEAAAKADSRRWMRQWLDGRVPTQPPRAFDAETSAAVCFDQLRQGRPWKRDALLEPKFLLSCLADILEAILGAGHHEQIRAFARHAPMLQRDLPGIASLVLED